MKRTQAGARAQRAGLIGAVALTLAWALALAGCQAPGQTEAASDGWVRRLSGGTMSKCA